MRRLGIALVIAAALIGVTAFMLARNSGGHDSAWTKGHSYAQAHYTAWSMSGETPSFWCQSLAMQFDGTNGAWGTDWENGCTAWLHG